MLRIGITGQGGFIGWHLTQYLALLNEASIVQFERSFFDNFNRLKAFAQDCDVIVHLAAKNRDPNPDKLYKVNIELVYTLLRACEETNTSIYFTSSIQETNDNPYGKSKRKGWELIRQWGKENKRKVGSFVVPNVFGPFGKPNYNSVIATFCHMIAHGQDPTIINDGTIDLIHVQDLVEIIWRGIESDQTGRIEVKPHYKKKVSEVYELLQVYNSTYLEKGVFPALDDKFELQLFNMFRTYIPNDHYPVSYVKHSDTRGYFVEIVRTNSSGQFSYSTTVPGITRGNHFHTRKAERFAVIKGRAKIQLRKIGTSEIIEYNLDGDEPSFVDMPIWYTHNITNVGVEELVTLFWINEPYDPNDPDTYYVNV